MSLATRLSAFFLAALAVVLTGFSLSLYGLAQLYVFTQAEERLQAALDTLSATVEPEAGGLEWEGEQRHLTLGRDAGPDQPRWEVSERSGLPVAQSANLANTSAALRTAFADLSSEARATRVRVDGETWLLTRRLLEADTGPTRLLKTRGDDQPHLYPALVLTAAVPLTPAENLLRNLAVALAGLSAVLWLAAAVVGRRLARRALAPLTQMAEAASAMDATDLDQRLPAPPTADELAELQHSFNGLLDRLQDAFERQQRFTGDASHQLRTPLTAMLGQLDLALRRDRPAEEYRRVLAEAHAQASRLRQIVEALLFLARANAEAQPAELTDVDLATWLPEQLRRWADHARRGDLQLVNTAAGPVVVRVQPLLLGQLLDNLLENACKYSRPGTPIQVLLERDGPAVRLTVADTGSGIAPADLPHVFEPFYRAAEARRLGLAGAGLGLAIAARIATALGGTLTVESELGQGSRFTLSLAAGGVA